MFTEIFNEYTHEFIEEFEELYKHKPLYYLLPIRDKSHIQNEEFIQSCFNYTGIRKYDSSRYAHAFEMTEIIGQQYLTFYDYTGCAVGHVKFYIRNSVMYIFCFDMCDTKLIEDTLEMMRVIDTAVNLLLREQIFISSYVVEIPLNDQYQDTLFCHKFMQLMGTMSGIHLLYTNFCLNNQYMQQVSNTNFVMNCTKYKYSSYNRYIADVSAPVKIKMQYFLTPDRLVVFDLNTNDMADIYPDDLTDALAFLYKHTASRNVNTLLLEKDPDVADLYASEFDFQPYAITYVRNLNECH